MQLYDDEGRLYVNVAIVKRFLPKIVSPLFGQNLTFGGIRKGSMLFSTFLNTQKALPCVQTRLLSHHASKSVQGSDM